jgi:Fe-S oxidoreductase
MDQSCCGLPVQMMGEKSAARSVARQNIEAFEQAGGDYIVTLCASCASHLKHGYLQILGDDPRWAAAARRFAAKVLSLQPVHHRILGLEADLFRDSGPPTTYHAPCHLCRGIEEREAPQALIHQRRPEFRPAVEEETCCGFGGTYSSKFPQISAQILARKLADDPRDESPVAGDRMPGLHHAAARRRGAPGRCGRSQAHCRSAGRPPPIGIQPANHGGTHCGSRRSRVGPGAFILYKRGGFE